MTAGYSSIAKKAPGKAVVTLSEISRGDAQAVFSRYARLPTAFLEVRMYRLLSYYFPATTKGQIVGILDLKH